MVKKGMPQQLSRQGNINSEDVIERFVIQPNANGTPYLENRDNLVKTLTAHFSNGFRVGSPIELSRFRRFFTEDFDEEPTLSDESLDEKILACGILFDGKVFVVNQDTTDEIKREVDSAIDGGAEIIFYGAFHRQNENWLLSANVISEDMLKVVLTNLYPQYVHKTNCFSPERRGGNEFVKIEREILRVWSDDILLGYDQLSRRLPYIPVDKIKGALAQGRNFVWNTEGVYTYTGRVDIDDKERTAILDCVATAHRKNGYASLSGVPLGEIAERNCQLSLTAVHNAIFALVLSDKYDRRGKIITRKGGTLDALTIMKEYCRSLERCSLQDLLDFERELTGETHRWIPMEAAYAVLIRIDKDTFVADRYVNFNVDLIDAAIEMLVVGDCLPLKSFAAFGAFPDCGQAWNLFLLESYCRRFSRKYRFDAPSVNSRNAGAVIRKSCGMNYTEIMANAAATADIPLKDTVVGRFLFDNGYTGRSTTAKVGEIIDKARGIRRELNDARN
jgi:hypothetical protein